jgi:polygalacturonase
MLSRLGTAHVSSLAVCVLVVAAGSASTTTARAAAAGSPSPAPFNNNIRISTAVGKVAHADTTARADLLWKEVSIEDFGAKGDNATDNTKAFRAALLAVKDSGGGEVLVPAGGVFRTGPVNLTSNTVLRVEGTMRALTDRDAFPKIGILPSVGHDYDTNGPARRMPFVFAVGGRNITVRGGGTIDAAGRCDLRDMSFRMSPAKCLKSHCLP